MDALPLQNAPLLIKQLKTFILRTEFILRSESQNVAPSHIFLQFHSEVAQAPPKTYTSVAFSA